MKKLVLIISLFVVSAGYAQNLEKNFTKILGEWHFDVQDYLFLEIWEKVSPNTFEGKMYQIHFNSGDTLTSEHIRLVEASGEIYYVVFGAGNNDMPVPFKLTGLSDTNAVFENPAHDFPQKIEYLWDGNKLTAYISAEGKKPAPFYFRKPKK